jgi:aminopeptidase N
MSIRENLGHERCRCASHQGTARRRSFHTSNTPRRYSRDRVIDVKHIRLEIFVDYENRAIRGVCTTRAVAFNDGLTAIELDSKELQIESVTIEGEGAAKFSLVEDKLRIELGKPYSKGQDISLSIRYKGNPRRGMYFIAPDEAHPKKHPQVWTQGQDEDARYWFPCFDYPNQKATTEVIASVPKGWFALSNGSLVGKRDDGNHTIFHWKQDVPHVTYLVTLAAGEYVALEEKHGELQVVAYVPPGDEEAGKRSFSQTKDMIALFESRTGQTYPYAKYAQIVVEDFIFGGMENTSATTLTDLSLYDEATEQDHVADSLVAHELAHQWFGDLLTCRDWSHAWLNEGFATYSESLWEEHRRGIDEMHYYLYETAQGYFSEDSGRYRRSIVSQRYEDPLDLFDRHLYEKGGLVLHMLRYVLGEEPFWRSIHHYVKENAQKNVTTQDLMKAIEQATGKNLEWFFDQWIFGAGHPEYETSYSWDAETKLASVSVKQTQEETDDTKLFKMPVVLAFVVSGEEKRFTVTVDKKEHTFYFPLAEEPKDFRFDPGNFILKNIKTKKPKNMNLYQLSNDSDVIGRIYAAEALGDNAESDAITALGDALTLQPFWAVRAEVARVLGKVKNARARGFLREGLRDPSSKVRRAVVEALGEFRGDQEVEGWLSPLIQNDTSYFVRGEAAKSLGKLRTPKALEGIQAALQRDAWADVTRTKALEGLSALRDERGINIAKEFTRYGQKLQARGTAVMTLARLAEEYPEKKPDIIDHLIELTEQPGFRVHLALCSALGRLKDPKAIAALERLALREPDGRVRRFVRDAIREIREGKRSEETVKNLRDDLEKLRDENRGLKDRVEKLETRKEP